MLRNVYTVVEVVMPMVTYENDSNGINFTLDLEMAYLAIEFITSVL